MSHGLRLPLRPAKDTAEQVQAQGVQPRGYSHIYMSGSLSKVRIIDQTLKKHLRHIRTLSHKNEQELLPTLKDPTVQPSGSHLRHTASAT